MSLPPREITDIVTWVKAFTVYSWIFCSAHPYRWQDMMQYKLLILKASHQFPGKAWRCQAALRHCLPKRCSWSCMALDLYNFYTRPSPDPSKPVFQLPITTKLSANSSNFCRSWNDGTCRWPFGQCRYRHSRKKMQRRPPPPFCRPI